MLAVVGQAEAHEHGFQAQRLFQQHGHRNGAARALQHRLPLKARGVGPGGGAHGRVAGGHFVGPGVQLRRERSQHLRRRVPGQVGAQLSFHRVRVLAGGEAEAELGPGHGRNNRLGARALVAPAQTGDAERRPQRGALVEAKAGFAPALPYPGLAQQLRIGQRVAGGVGPFGGCYRLHGIIKTGQRDAALRVVEAGQQLAQGLQRVEYGPAENTGVQLCARAAHFQLGAEAAA